MAEVGWAEQALDDVKAIGAYIAQFDTAAAARMQARLKAAGDSLSIYPLRGRRVRGRFRVLAHIRPYLIYYLVIDEHVSIVTVRHGARRRL